MARGSGGAFSKRVMMAEGAMEKILWRIRWLGHAGFVIEGSLTVYIDPFDLRGELPTADVVLITRNHPERCSIPDVMKISRVQTVVAGPPDAVCRFRLNQLPLAPGQARPILGALVTATAGAPGQEPSTEQGLGFLLELDGARIYYSDDANGVESKKLQADIALSPITGDVLRV